MNIKIKIYFNNDNIMSVTKSTVENPQISFLRKLSEICDEINDLRCFSDENNNLRRISEKELIIKNSKEFALIDGYRQNLKQQLKDEALMLKNAIINSSKTIMHR